MVWANDGASVTYDPNAVDGGSATDTGGGFFTDMVSNLNSSVQNAFTDPASALSNTNVQAFLRMVRVGEGTSGPNGYNTLFGAASSRTCRAIPT